MIAKTRIVLYFDLVKKIVIMKTKTAAILIGLVFIGVGLLGYTSNPIIGESPDAIFHADSTHNIVHIVSGVSFLLFALTIPGYTRMFLKLFGVVYLLIGILGLLKIGDTGMTKIFGFLHVNGADNYLHIGLGVIIFLAGTVTSRSSYGRNP
jgi:hypothetical protein